MDKLMNFLPLFVLAVAFIFIYMFLKTKKPSNTSYKSAVALALVAAFFLIWVSAGVGIFGSPDPLEIGALAVGAIGATIARFQPKGMAYALFATALVQASVGLISLSTGSASPNFWPHELFLNGFFVALFAASALLFRNAAREQAAAEA